MTVREDALVLLDSSVIVVKVSAPKVNLVIIVDRFVIVMVESVIMYMELVNVRMEVSIKIVKRNVFAKMVGNASIMDFVFVSQDTQGFVVKKNVSLDGMEKVVHFNVTVMVPAVIILQENAFALPVIMELIAMKNVHKDISAIHVKTDVHVGIMKHVIMSMGNAIEYKLIMNIKQY